MDGQDKATYWSITSFDEGEWGRLEGDEYPDWLESVSGGKEECPDTKRIHFQGMLKCRRQVRFAAVKGWLPEAHIEAAKNPKALKKYVMKSDTAVGDKAEKTNQRPYITMTAFLASLCAYKGTFDMVTALATHKGSLEKCYDDEYWHCVNAYITEQKDTVLINYLLALAALPPARLLWKKARPIIQLQYALSTSPPSAAAAEGGDDALHLSITGEDSPRASASPFMEDMEESD